MIESIEGLLKLLNLLIVPALVYVVKIEKRITKLETKCDIYFNGKKKD